MSTVLEKAGLSPSSHLSQLGSRLDRKRKRDTAWKLTKEFKWRRLFLKDSRSSKQASNKVQEGVTYSPGCGMTTLSSSSSTEIPGPPPPFV